MLVDIPVASDGTQKINWIMFLTMFADKMEGASASVADAGGRAKLCGGSPPWLAGRASERGPKGVSVCRPSLTPFRRCISRAGIPATGTDPEEVIKNAFSCFDASGTGSIDEEQCVPPSPSPLPA